MTTAPRHGAQAADDMSWLASINPTPPRQAEYAHAPEPQAWPAGGRITVTTRPSIPRVAAGVYLGLVMFTITCAGVAVLLATVAAGVLADAGVTTP
jgi:hypothetical protein